MQLGERGEGERERESKPGSKQACESWSGREWGRRAESSRCSGREAARWKGRRAELGLYSSGGWELWGGGALTSPPTPAPPFPCGTEPRPALFWHDLLSVVECLLHARHCTGPQGRAVSSSESLPPRRRGRKGCVSTRPRWVDFAVTAVKGGKVGTRRLRASCRAYIRASHAQAVFQADGAAGAKALRQEHVG